MPLSIGIEVEAVIISQSNNEPLPPSEQSRLALVASTLSGAGLQARAYIPASTRSVPNYSVWNVVIDATISEVTSQSDSSDSAYASRFGVEIVSPIFYDTDDSSWRDEVTEAMGAITRKFSWKANRSTGLHIHVGRGQGDQFTLHQLKRMAVLVVRFEEAINKFHPSHRNIANDNIVSNRGNALLRDLTLPVIYDRIFNVLSVEELCKVMNYTEDDTSYDGYEDSKFFKVNFTSLAKHQTVEFRQHEGTTDPSKILRWTHFVLRFVQYALDATDAEVVGPGETADHLAQLVALP